MNPTEYDLLKLLSSQAGKVLTHRHILNNIWGPSHLEQPHGVLGNGEGNCHTTYTYDEVDFKRIEGLTVLKP